MSDPRFVIVTHYAPPSGKRPVVHAWGPYDGRGRAIYIAAKMRREATRDHGADAMAHVSYHTCEILPDDGPPPRERSARPARPQGTTPSAALAELIEAWQVLVAWNDDVRTYGGRRSRRVWQALDALAGLDEPEPQDPR